MNSDSGKSIPKGDTPADIDPDEFPTGVFKTLWVIFTAGAITLEEFEEKKQELLEQS